MVIKSLVIEYRFIDLRLFITSNYKYCNMQELVDKLKAEAGLTDEQAAKVLATIKDFVVDKFPMMAGAVDKLFEGK